MVNCPMAYGNLQLGPYDWQFKSEPQVHMRGRVSNWPRGKVLGGCSSINAMLYVRGAEACFDQWRDLGCEGWGADDVRPYFKMSECCRVATAAPGYHGTGARRPRTLPCHAD